MPKLFPDFYHLIEEGQKSVKNGCSKDDLVFPERSGSDRRSVFDLVLSHETG